MRLHTIIDVAYQIPVARHGLRRYRPPAPHLLVAALAVSATIDIASGADARSTPPGWNWATQSFNLPLRVDTANCTSIRVPVGGALVDASAAGEVCPSNMVAHGYIFNKRVTHVPTTPQYTLSGAPCSSVQPNISGTVVNPTTGQSYPRYRNVSREPCARNAWVWDWEVFWDWAYVTQYTIDANAIFLRCCPAAR
jgi:hypothetical protein